MAHAQTEALRTGLDRTRRECATATTFAVGPCDDDLDLVPGVDECAQRRYRGLGRPKERETHLLTQQLVQPVGVRRRELEVPLTKDLLRLSSLVGVQAFDEQYAVEVVHLVLEDPPLVLVGLDIDLIAVEIASDQVHGVSARDLPTEPGDRET